jgi:hypothetical protein
MIYLRHRLDNLSVAKRLSRAFLISLRPRGIPLLAAKTFNGAQSPQAAALSRPKQSAVI